MINGIVMIGKKGFGAMLMGDTLAYNALNDPEGEALVFEGRRLTWRDVNEGANRAANAFTALGLRPGERVVYNLNNSVEFVEIFYGLAKAGLIGAPVMPQSVGREIAHVVNDLDARVIICEAGLAPAVLDAGDDMPGLGEVIGVGDGHPFGRDYHKLTHHASAEEPDLVLDPDDVLAVKYTSGTTGVPKGCMRTHRQLLLAATSLLFHVPHEDGDRVSIATLMAAGASLSIVILSVLRGVTMVLLPKFDATRLLETIERERITVTYASLTPFMRVIFHPDLDKFDLSSVRIFSGTSPTGQTLEGYRKISALPTFKGGFYTGYGSSEAGGRATFLLPGDCRRALTDPAFEHIAESLGRVARLNRVECMDADMRPVPAGAFGEMAIKAPTVFEGYWGRPEETAQCFRDGWLMTGDVMRKDEHGYCYLAGRTREMIKTGGVNVYPAEIEPVIAAHAHVHQAAVIGIPDAEWGEKVVACVVPRGECTEAEILEFCKDKLAAYKRPKMVRFLDELPSNAIGKIVKDDLKAMLVGDGGE